MNNGQCARKIEILIADDNPGDVRLIKEALRESKVLNAIHAVGNGIEALAFMRKEGKYSDMPTPDLVLLDINMPKKGGIETLKEIKEDKDLKRIPVVILTASSAEEDIIKSYDKHANCYITKPMDFDQFHKIVKSIESFWLTVVTLPTNNNGG